MLDDVHERHKRRAIIFVIVALFHIGAIFLVAFTGGGNSSVRESSAEVFNLSDFDEAPPPPPPDEPQVENTSEDVAENILESEKPVETSSANANTQSTAQEEYLPQNKISKVPVFNEKDILSNLVYPQIAQRSGIEGTVVLELFINKRGEVTRIRILKESPAEYGFGAAAVSAFTGLRCTPAQAGGEDVAVRYRYPVRFQLRN